MPAYAVRHVSIRMPWHGTLIITHDEPNGSIDSAKIDDLLEELCL